MSEQTTRRPADVRTRRPVFGAVLFIGAAIFFLGMVAGLVTSPSWMDVVGLVLFGPLTALFARDGLSYIRNR